MVTTRSPARTAMLDLRLPRPEDRVPADMYRAARGWLLANDPDAPRMIEWSLNGTRPPMNAEDMACEVIWIILCAGRSAQAARTIEAKVFRAIRAGEPVVTAFGYRAKAAAIERAWREREADFMTLQDTLSTGDVVQLLEWCRGIPFVGEVTKYQLAKNFGAAVCKPDLCYLPVTIFGLEGIPKKSYALVAPPTMWAKFR